MLGKVVISKWRNPVRDLKQEGNSHVQDTVVYYLALLRIGNFKTINW